MKLLMDENLSRRLVPFLQHAYPGTRQVALLGLESADDVSIWQFAKDQDFTIVTRDADLQEFTLVWGQPPQVIWLKAHKQRRAATHKVLLDNSEAIHTALVEEKAPSIEIMA